MPTEGRLLEENGVTVTTARLVVPRQTYAMSAITSVKSVTLKPPPYLGIVGVIGGIAVLTGEQGAMTIGFVLIGVAVVRWVRNPTRHVVVVTTAAGESHAVSSRDARFIARIIDAVNEAIVARG